MPQISIIIPIYNTEPYLPRCIESVINQTLKDIEIICVDDGSTDNSAAILDEYAKQDMRIKVIHKKNEGLVSARKTGIANAIGKYAGYVDSDDYIESDMYEILYSAMLENQADLITCGYYLEGNYTTEHIDTVEEGLYTGEKIKYLREHTIYNFACRETGLRGSLCCKLFRTDLLQKVQNSIPNHISIAEDKICLVRYILDCSSVFVIRKPLYHWVINPRSMSHESQEWNNDYLVKINFVYNHFMTLYRHPNFTDDMKTQVEIYMMELIFLGINKRMGFRNKNMLWIDPYWMDLLKRDCRVVLFGGGELGEKYMKQLKCVRPDVELVSCIELQCPEPSGGSFKTEQPKMPQESAYDYVVITIKNEGKAERVREGLIREGIPHEKIIWCRQSEIYWKFIEAEGLIAEEEK